jgi:hypothetical protein
MTRTLAVTLALLLAAAPLSPAAAQDRGRRGEQDRPRQEQSQQDRPREQPRRMSEAQAQSIAQSRAGGARFVGSRGLQGNSYVFVFDDGGRVFSVSVSAN